MGKKSQSGHEKSEKSMELKENAILFTRERERERENHKKEISESQQHLRSCVHSKSKKGKKERPVQEN